MDSIVRRKNETVYNVKIAYEAVQQSIRKKKLEQVALEKQLHDLKIQYEHLHLNFQQVLRERAGLEEALSLYKEKLNIVPVVVSRSTEALTLQSRELGLLGDKIEELREVSESEKAKLSLLQDRNQCLENEHAWLCNDSGHHERLVHSLQVERAAHENEATGLEESLANLELEITEWKDKSATQDANQKNSCAQMICINDEIAQNEAHLALHKQKLCALKECEAHLEKQCVDFDDIIALKSKEKQSRERLSIITILEGKVLELETKVATATQQAIQWKTSTIASNKKTNDTYVKENISLEQKCAQLERDLEMLRERQQMMQEPTKEHTELIVPEVDSVTEPSQASKIHNMKTTVVTRPPKPPTTKNRRRRRSRVLHSSYRSKAQEGSFCETSINLFDDQSFYD